MLKLERKGKGLEALMALAQKGMTEIFELQNAALAD